MLLDSFDGTTQGEEHGTIGYTSSLTTLDQAVDLQTGNWVKYAVPSWYTGQGSGTGTVETWVYPRMYSIALGTLQWNNTSTSPPAGYIGNLTINIDGHLYWSPWRAVTVPPAPAPTGSSVVPLNQWTHVAVTWGPSGTSLYVNGMLDGYSAGNWDPYLQSTTYVYLNGWGGTDLGLVDEFRISSVARSEAEIRAYVVEILNEPPVSDPNGPYLGAIDAQVDFDGSASSDPDGDSLVYDWDWGDTSSSSDAGATPTHAYGAAGIYDVCLTATDHHGESDTACTYAVVYDASGGFVTGGGWIDSPDGAMASAPTGKATFGFVSKYKKGAEAPTGSTEFQFQAGDLDFHSTSYDWLVVTGSDYAKFKGVGTINGAGEYKFKIWAGDNEPDTFRIKIWTETDGTETIVYDNGMDQSINGGSIIIHTKK